MSGFLVKAAGIFFLASLAYFLVMKYSTAGVMIGTSFVSVAALAFLATGVFLWFGVKVK